MAALQATGFDGLLSLEIFSDRFRAGSARRVGASRPVALNEFGCDVLLATDDLDAIVTNQVTCSVVAP